MSDTFNLSKRWEKRLFDQGIDPREILKTANVSINSIMHGSHFKIAIDDYFRIWRAMEESNAQKDWSLKLIQLIIPDEFNPIYFAALCSPNLKAALQRLREFKLLISPMQLNLTDAPTGLRANMQITLPNKDVPASYEATELAFIVHLMRIGTKEHLTPSEVILPEKLKDPYQNFFGIKAKTGDDVSVTFAHADLKRPLVTQDERMWQFFEPQLRQNLNNLNSYKPVRDRVYSILLELLPAGKSTAADVATKIGMSKRTLQRKLQDEGSSYQTILKNVRLDLARYYLQYEHLSGIEIALLLGYDSQSAFIRAFTNWTGVPPSRFLSEQKHT